MNQEVDGAALRNLQTGESNKTDARRLIAFAEDVVTNWSFDMQKPTKETLGDLFIQSLTDVRDGLRGQPGKLTMKTVEIPDPPQFDASAIHSSKLLRCARDISEQ